MYFYVVACFTCIIISSLLGRRVRSIPSIKHIHHHHKHQGLNPLIRSVSTVTAARANASLIFQLFSFLVVCSGMISKGFGFVAYFASVKTSSVCIRLSCLGLIHSFTYIFIWVRKLDCNSSIKTKK